MTHPFPSQIKILVVDDEPAVLQYLLAVLNRPGMQVQSAGHPQEALRMLATQVDSFHLLITDVHMQPMNGVELARKARDLFPPIRVLYISGYSNVQDWVTQDVLDGQSDFLRKPFNPGTLWQKLEEILSLRVPDGWSPGH